MNNQPTVCFTANNLYAQHFAVSCYSLLKNSPAPWRIFLLSDDLTASNESKLKKMVAKEFKGATLQVIRVDANRFSYLPKIGRLGLQAYFRLKMDELLPSDVDNLLYLDSDLIVKKPIDDLFNKPAEIPLMAVLDGASQSQVEARNLSRGYFNSGVLYLSLKHWREHKLSDKLLERSYQNLVMADQDMLNDFFDGTWKELDPTYNVKAFHAKNMGVLPRFVLPDRSATIIHYMDVWKPWKRLFYPGIIYWIYLFKTPFWPKCIDVLSAAFNSSKFILSSRVFNRISKQAIISSN